MAHVEKITALNPKLITPVLAELEPVDWVNLPNYGRTSKEFATSHTLHLRVHSPTVVPNSLGLSRVERYGQILECINTQNVMTYLEVMKLANTVRLIVKGKRLGRVMVVNLLPLSGVGLHVDPGPYFQTYKRFHVPLKTHSEVVFLGPEGTTPIHMEYSNLYRLENTERHGVWNGSLTNRIHLIADVET